MTEREKAIKEFALFIKKFHPACTSEGVELDLFREVLALLKEQEPKQVGLYGNDEWLGLVCVCPNCKSEWMSAKGDTHFCPNCGQAVKWDDK